MAITDDVIQQAEARFIAFRQNHHSAVFRYVALADFRPTRDRNAEIVGKSPQERRRGEAIAVPEHPECLFRQIIFWHAVEIMHRSLRAPADVETGKKL